jgi:hypothetical protein
MIIVLKTGTWLAKSFILFGMWKLSENHKEGFVYSLLGARFWRIHGIYTFSSALIFINAVSAAIFVRNWILWNRRN